MQAPRLKEIEIDMCVEDASSTQELVGAVIAVALSRPRPLDERGQPVGTLTIELSDVGGNDDEGEDVGVSAEGEVVTHTLAFMGRGGWVTVREGSCRW
jgi:hypothetical protein